MNIAEIFYSVQGEGMLTGVPCLYPHQRLQSSMHVVRYSVHFMAARRRGLEVVEGLPAAHHGEFPAARRVVADGDAEVSFAEIVALTDALHPAGLHITVETAGPLPAGRLRPDEY